MTEVRLEDFEKQIIVRPMLITDYDAVVQMQLKCFPNMKPWRREQIQSQLSIFPEGQFVVEYEGKIVASASSLIIDFDLYTSRNSWKDLTDNGYIRNHNPKGDTLYGIEIMVDPEYRGMKLARRLYDARKQIAIDRNLPRIIIGGRIPGYAEHADEMSAKEYVGKVMQKVLIDPVLTVQVANGFVLKRLIPEYLKSDKDSKGYATFLEWTNLDYVPETQRAHLTKAMARICVVQMKMREISNFEDFGRCCEFFIDSASEYKSDFILFPELFTSQLLSLVQFEKPDLAVRHLSDFTGQYLERFAELAIKYNINIVGGSHLSIENEKLYNISYLFRRDGTLGKQRKLHIAPDEVRWWGLNAGADVEVFDTDCGPISIQIGSDIIFPEPSRIAAEKGAQIIFVPCAAEERYAQLRIRHCAQARAIENHTYVVTAGLVGMMAKSKYFDIRYAQSGLYTPSDISYLRGDVPTECSPNVETVMFEELDLSLLRRGRQSEMAVSHKKARNKLFPMNA